MDLKTYLLNRVESRVCRLNGILQSSNLPQKSELRQSFADHVMYSSEQLPPKVDLRPYMTAVEDQSQIGSCVANTLAGAYEYLTKKVNGNEIDVSRLFIYYNARVDGDPSGALTDSGCSMTSGIETLENHGVCLESLWPYDIERVNDRPSRSAYQEAKESRITEALQVDVDLTQMKSCLAQGFPFAFGLSLFTSFDKASKSGVVPMPDQYEQGRQAHGSHAMLAVGYSDQSRSFIVRNSWGVHWGDKGYCYIPYDYMTNPNLCFEIWAIRQLNADEIGQDTWDNDDTVDYHPDEEVGQDEENQVEIGQYQSQEELMEDLKNFAGQMLNSFISLAF